MISLKQTLKAITSKFSALNTLLNDVPHYTLLWTNPNPTSSFSAQTISLDLSKYDAVEVVFKRYTSQAIYSTQTLLEKGIKFALGTTTDETFRYRTCSFSNSGVTFDTPQYMPSYGSWNPTATNNNCEIPYKIYGIKFGGGYKALRSLFAKEVAV